ENDDDELSFFGMDGFLPRSAHARRLRCSADGNRLAGVSPGTPAGHGPAVASAPAGRARWKCRSGGPDGLCQWRPACTKRAGNRFLPRFSAGNLSPNGAALRDPRQPRRHRAAGTRDAVLCPGSSGAQLGNGRFYLYGRQFCRADDGAAGGPTIPPGYEVSRSALISSANRAVDQLGRSGAVARTRKSDDKSQILSDRRDGASKFLHGSLLRSITAPSCRALAALPCGASGIHRVMQGWKVFGGIKYRDGPVKVIWTREEERRIL